MFYLQEYIQYTLFINEQTVGKMIITHFFVTTINGSSNSLPSSVTARRLELEPNGLFSLVWGFFLAEADINNTSLRPNLQK